MMKRRDSLYLFEDDYIAHLQKENKTGSSNVTTMYYTKKAYIEWAAKTYAITKAAARARFEKLNKRGGGKDDECTVCYKEPESFLIKYTCYKCSQPLCERCMSEMIAKGLFACPSCRSHFQGMQISVKNNPNLGNSLKTLLTYMSKAEQHPDMKNNRFKAFVLAYVYSLVKQGKTKLEFTYSIHDFLWIASLAVLLMGHYSGRVLPSIYEIDIMVVFLLFVCTYKKTFLRVDDMLLSYLSPKNKEIVQFFTKDVNVDILLSYMMTCGFFAPTAYELGFDEASRTATVKFLREFYDALEMSVMFLTERNLGGKYDAVIQDLKRIIPSFKSMITYVESR